MTIADQITRLNNAKAAIKQSIENKGVTVGEDVKLDKYAEYIDNIEIGSGDSGSGSDSEYAWPDFYELRTRKSKSKFSLFAYMYIKESEVRYKDLVENLDTTETTNFNYMFNYFNYGESDYIKELDLTGYDVSKGTDFTETFQYCKLDYLNISGWDFSSYSNITNHRMFYKSYIKEINMSNCYMSKVTDLYYLAGSSDELITIDMTGCDTSNVTRFNGMISDCPKLTTIIGELDISKCTSGLYASSSANPFADCPSLETLYLKNIYKNVTLTNASKWSINLKDTKVKDECLVYIINELPDLINDKKLTATDKIVFTLPPTNTLTQEQVQVARDKGWQVANTTY